MACKGICLRHRAQKPVDSGRYASGQKRCQVCEIFINWDTLWCPCCGYRLRSKPRNSLFKKKFGITRKLQGQENKIKAAIPVRY
jgi:RNA polymerase subunit RPABC4/transcription elongation factor Spt4